MLNMFCTELKKSRAKLGITQAQMAERVGVPISTYKSWEVRQALPSAENWLKLKDVLKKHYLHKDIEELYAVEKAVKN